MVERRDFLVSFIGFLVLVAASQCEGRLRSQIKKAPQQFDQIEYPEPPLPLPPTIATTTTSTTTTTPSTTTTTSSTTTARARETTETATKATPTTTITTAKPTEETTASAETDNLPTCDGGLKDALKYFATKTPYLSRDASKDPITPPGCSAVEIWILGRHGTRYPGDDDIIDMQSKLPAFRNLIRNSSWSATICPAELGAILNWEPDRKLNVSQESWLVDQGYREWHEISKRFQERFPELFPPTFSDDKYYFRGTKEQRAQESAKAFAGAIFGQSLPGFKPAPSIKGDPILHFYKTCKKWKEEVDDNPAAKYEHEKFLRSPVFEETKKEVGERLGIGRNVTEDELLLIYKTCNFETAWNPRKPSPWCAVFSKGNLEVLEYQEDLEDYWMDGYAYPITYEQACTPIKDVVERFSAKIVTKDRFMEPSTRLTTAYFGHSGTILKIYARLGLFKDSENLTSDSFSKFSHSSRQWLNSKMGKFASNIAFVLFKCASPPSDCDSNFNQNSNSSVNDNFEYKIGALVQEKKIPLQACGGDWICPFEEFANNVRNIVDTCNLDEICKVDERLSTISPFRDLMR